MQGLKVSKPGKAVASTDPRDFTLHSQYNIPKIATEGSGTISINNVTYLNSVNITHNLGYKPQVLLYMQHPATDIWFLSPGKFDSSYDDSTYSISITSSHVNVNTIRFEFGVDNLAPSYPVTIPYKYFILVEPREDAWYD
jgi:hypothetical protein